jgi:hypothetical protein
MVDAQEKESAANPQGEVWDELISIGSYVVNFCTSCFNLLLRISVYPCHTFRSIGATKKDHAMLVN